MLGDGVQPQGLIVTPASLPSSKGPQGPTITPSRLPPQGPLQGLRMSTFPITTLLFHWLFKEDSKSCVLDKIPESHPVYFSYASGLPGGV